ncbi:MAG: hypothetical protein ACTFAK_07045 [Candidatus Electronema sp. VV]
MFNSPLHTLLVASGLFFLLLTIVSQIGGIITVSAERQKLSAAIGSVLLALGIGLHFKSAAPPTRQTPEDILSDYLHRINSRQFAAAQMLNPKLNIEATSRWMEQISSINLVDFQMQDAAPDRAAKIRYCRKDGSGTDEEKLFLFKKHEDSWLIQNENQPRSVKPVRCF